MKSLFIAASIGLGLAGAALADDPTPAPEAAANPPATAPAAPDAAVQKSPTSTKTDPGSEANNKKVRALGYKPKKTKDGQTVWCKREAKLGSRFEEETCMAADTILARIQADKDTVERTQRTSNLGKLYSD